VGPCSYTMVHFSPLSCDQGIPLTDAESASYRRLIYLTNKRPGIAFSVNKLSQFVSTLASTHHQATFRILIYLKNAPCHGIYLSTRSIHQLKAYSDSDWASCPETRNFVTGFSIYLGNSVISCKSKKQRTVSRSSFEAEYKVMTFTAYEIQWLTYLL